MKRFYSANTGGFYLEGVNDNIPPDAVPVDEDQFSSLMEAQASGLEIRPGPDGHPAAVARPLSDARRLELIRLRRNDLLAASDFTQLPDSPLSPDQRQAWAIYRAALRNLPEDAASDPSAVAWPAPPT